MMWKVKFIQYNCENNVTGQSKCKTEIGTSQAADKTVPDYCYNGTILLQANNCLFGYSPFRLGIEFVDHASLSHKCLWHLQ